MERREPKYPRPMDLEELAGFVMGGIVEGELPGDPVVELHKACQAVIDSYGGRRTVEGAWRFHKSVALMRSRLAVSRSSRRTMTEGGDPQSPPS